MNEKKSEWEFFIVRCGKIVSIKRKGVGGDKIEEFVFANVIEFSWKIFNSNYCSHELIGIPIINNFESSKSFSEIIISSAH